MSKIKVRRTRSGGKRHALSHTCRTCGSKCCQYFCFEIDEPDDFEEFEDIRWYLSHDGISVHVDEGDWYISIPNRCTKLTDEGDCGIYDTRPLICRSYDTDNCDYTEGNYGYDHEFFKPEDIDAYAREILGDQGYDRQQASAWAKADAAVAKMAAAKRPL